MVEALVAAVAAGVVLWVFGAYTLSIAKMFVRVWVWLYTAPLHPEVRARRREEIASDVWEHETADREAGYRPAETGIRVFVRSVRGVPSDMAWSAPQWFELHETADVLTGVGMFYMAITYQELSGPLPAIGPMPAEGADLVFRALFVFMGVETIREFLWRRRVRFSNPLGSGLEAYTARMRVIEAAMIAEYRAGRRHSLIATAIRAFRRRRSRRP